MSAEPRIEIAKWGKNVSLDKQPGMMVRVDRDTALRLIASLAQQLQTNNPNTHRLEMRSNLGYFSIAVHQEIKS